MSITKQINEIEELISKIESDRTDFDDQIKLYESTKKKLQKLKKDLDSRSNKIKTIDSNDI